MEFLLHHLLEAAARRHPERPAVVDGERAVDYATLDRRANALAHLLIDRGVGAGDRVGLYLEKSLESIVAIYGVLKAGGAYVPLDPRAPVMRLAKIARNADIRLLIAGKETVGKVPDLCAGGAPLEQVMVLSADSPGEPRLDGVTVLGQNRLKGLPDHPPATGTIDVDLAYILYTSGSTGDPKGVMISHRNSLTFVDWASSETALQPSDRLSSHAPLHFDLSIFDIFAAARGAAAVVLVPPETSAFPRAVAKFIEEHGITVWYSVPSVLSMLALRGGLERGDLPRLRTILFAGEVFPVPYLRALMTQLPHVRFYNLYGPTETNVCTFYEVSPLPEDQLSPVPIGKAIPNVGVVVMGEDGLPVPRGEVGELWVRGSGVMCGYWRDAEMTATRLQARAATSGPADTLYRTGDEVRERGDGNLDFLGRRDAQIKSRGHRIELGDIETALHAHSAVVECAAVAVPDPLVTNRISAYVVLRDGATETDVLDACATRVPDYMVPDELLTLDRLPRTSTGKIDRRALEATVKG
ncbi:MAG: amino acid adenylation domain-containing protein [Chloroflexota bacterium]|nr:amino acid adenylation domain-containing protein [Chloroflexota bacterium]